MGPVIQNSWCQDIISCHISPQGGQEKLFASGASCVGLSERIRPRNHDRSVKDPEKQTQLSTHRVDAFKDRRSMDPPTVPQR